jgi:hypothetical protein
MIFGLDLQRGDEVVFTTQNYPRMQTSWRQRERRDGVVLKRVKIETPVKSTASYLEQIANAITPRTKVIEVMHISFMTGYIAPVRDRGPRASPGHSGIRRRAHAFGHFPFTRDEQLRLLRLNLHKWLHADRHGLPLRAARQKSHSGRSWRGPSRTTTSGVRGDRHASGGESTTPSRWRLHSTRHWSRAEDRRLRYLRDRWANRLLAASIAQDDHRDRAEDERRHRRVWRRRMDMGSSANGLSKHNIVTYR